MSIARLCGKFSFQVGLGAFTRLAVLLLALAHQGCDRHPHASGPLPQRGYLWQRAWTPAVSAALGDAAGHLQGVVLLGAETKVVEGKLQTQRANIDWAAVQRAGTPCAVALRIAPYGGPFAEADPVAKAIAALARELCAKARNHGVELVEFQLDFDCAQKKLAGYHTWVRAVRAVVAPLPLVITTLPSWLEERDFAALVRAADGYVLQVHSVPVKAGAQLCDPAQARTWVKRAEKIGLPFWVALPTYRCLAGYGPGGKLLGVAMDAAQPKWPPGTRTLELAASPGELAGLVHHWQSDRPAHLRGLLWYRLPVATDVRNWRWPTLAAVQAGRAPHPRLEVLQTDDETVDLALRNAGEADEPLDSPVTVTWSGPQPVAADALPGWSFQVEPGRALFFPEASARLRLPPGEKRAIGWLRYENRTPLQVEVAEPRSAGAAP